MGILYFTLNLLMFFGILERKEYAYTNCLKKYVFHHKYVMISVLFDVFFLNLNSLKIIIEIRL